MYLSDVFDYYILMSLSLKDTDGGFDFAKTRLVNDARVAMAELESSLAETFRNYLLLAGAGEARHAEPLCTGMIEGLPTNISRSGAVGFAQRYDWRILSERLTVLFNEYSWSSGYGGPRWGEITAHAGLFGKVHNGFIVDHVVDLQHNGGRLFDKGQALRAASLYVDCDESTFRRFCDVKSSALDLLAPDIFDVYVYEHLSNKTRRMMARYYRTYQNSEPPSCFTRPTTDKGWCEFSPVTWGDEIPGEVVARENIHYCESCGDPIAYDDEHEHDGDYYCDSCFHDTFDYCEECDEYYMTDDMKRVHTKHGKEWVCRWCADNHYHQCENCGKYFADNMVHVVDEITLCDKCFMNHANTCCVCKEVHYKHNMILVWLGYKDHVCGDDCLEKFNQDSASYYEGYKDPGNVYLPGLSK